MNHSVLPSWLLDAALSDAPFARAFDAVGGERRALLKTAIARLTAIYGIADVVASREDRTYGAGFSFCRKTTVARCSLIVLCEGFASPAALLASLVPALLAGVPDVVVVRLTGDDPEPWPDGMLCAMELAGQELAVDLDSESFRALLADMPGAGIPCRCLALGTPSEEVLAVLTAQRRRGLDYRILTEPSALSAWFDPSFDYEAVAWAHPNAARTCWNAAEENIPQWECVHGSWDEFIIQPSDVYLAPADLVADLQGGANLVLGPGAEGCWLYPELNLGYFQHHVVALGPEGMTRS
ncbi:hypothetical protein DPQ33_14115 [Oceanidesulfovibrio indonesiensis]|uniref:Uncharacterized protein n=1 Tax=Oceanidesulfovibrio indonesiensis TaxID=54767 RepID=A0A7M3MCQ0_9BACT|nr:hypothetical protein [Oceanidesulfovibrio indonesiensis]TVM15835.1 hypothetical protein DPQ33_14115 [Oceanidesulfovibrio indonesiensis]